MSSPRIRRAFGTVTQVIHRPLLVVYCAVLAIAWVLNTLVAIREPIWSPRDEIAHFDYIDRLSSGEIPDPRSPVLQYTLLLCSKYFTWNAPPSFNGSVASMGTAGRSYEAEQPLLYYAALALPHRLLKGRVSPETGVRALRLASLSFVFGAALLVILTASRVARVAPAHGAWLLITALLLSITNIPAYATLGNDSLSALFGALVLFLSVRTLEEPTRQSTLLWLSVTVSISVLLVKATNASLVVAPLYLSLFPRLGEARRFPLKRIAYGLAPLSPVAAWVLYRSFYSRTGLGSYAAQKYFAPWVSGIPSPPVFLQTLLSESLNMSHIGLGPLPIVGVVLGLLLLVALADHAVAPNGSPA